MLRSIAARRERRRCRRRSALRCVSKHEGKGIARLILRDARTRVRIRRTSSACALLWMRTSISHGTVHHFKQPISFPRRVFLRRGFASLLRSPPVRGGRSAERRSGARRNTRGRARNAARQALPRRLASHDAGRSPLGAPPWRFWAPGPRFSHRHPPRLALRRASARFQRAPRSQVVVPGGRLPCLPRRRLRAAAAGRHSPLRLQDASGRRPSKSEDATLVASMQSVVKC
jgi:hypothetical protein